MKNQITKESLEQLHKLLDAKEKVNCVIVVTSKKTGKDNTYKIKGNPYNEGSYFLDIRIETDYNKFEKVAYCFNDTVSLLGKYKDTDSPTIKGAYWLLKSLMAGLYDFILEKTTITHTGTCMKCGRELTDATSIEFGMGSTCRNK